MARLKSIGFEQDTLAANSEIYSVTGSPIIVSNINPNTNLAAVWDSASDTWNSETVPWPISSSGGQFDPQGVHGGYKALLMHNGDSIQIPATIKGGGGYFRAYCQFKTLPESDSNALMSFKRASDNKSMVSIDIAPGGILSMNYREDSTPATTKGTIVGQVSQSVVTGEYHRIEFSVVGDETGTTRQIEGKIDGVTFASFQIDNVSATDGFFTIGEANYIPGAYDMYVDDIAVNDATTDQNNRYPGDGYIVLLPVVGDDNVAGDWTRGGTDTGDDWSQVSDSSPPDDTSYLVGEAGNQIDLRLGSPYEAGIAAIDTINAVAANFRWELAGSGSADVQVYLRAGSNLPLQGRVINITGESWFSGDPNGDLPDPFSSALLPQSELPWTPEELGAARIGMLVQDADSNVRVSSLWAMVDYTPFTGNNNYQVLIDGVDRTNDVITSTMDIVDILYDQANTAQFDLEDIHSVGRPENGVTCEVIINGFVLFSGLIVKTTPTQISNNWDIWTINCIDWTRLLDRRLVAATYNDMLDSDIIDTIIANFAGDQGITTYHVAPGVTVAQLSESYIACSQAFDDLCTITGRFWYIDYNKDIHYFPIDQNQAPFDLTPDDGNFAALQAIKDDTQLKNRVYVKGGTTVTTEPFTEQQLADGVQTTFLLANTPLSPFTMTVDGVDQSVGIANVDDPTLFNYMLNDVEKSVTVGNASTPTAGKIMAFTYNYNIPVLVSVEDTNSVDEDGAYEFAIIDSTIGTTQAARDRAIAELTDYAQSLVTAQYTTEVPGLRSGMSQMINMPAKGIDEMVIINQVEANAIANGLFTYTVQVTSAKTIGIIKFLIEMLQANNNNAGTFDPNQTVDGFLGVSDDFDSMTDSLEDSMGDGAAKWSNDTGTTTDKLKWDLGQWK